MYLSTCGCTSCVLHRLSVLESLLHRIQIAREVAMDADKVVALLDKICTWSRAHREGNGELTEKEQQERIDKAFEAFYR